METQTGIVFLIIGIICGAIAGMVIGYLLFKNKSENNGDQTLKLEFEGERTRLQTELSGVREVLADQKAQTNQKEAQIGQLNTQLFNLSQEKIKLEANLENAIKNASEQLKTVNEAQTKMSETFTALSKQALDQNNASFVNHAEQVFKRFQESAQTDLQMRQEKITEIVQPVKDSLAKVDNHISSLEIERANTFAVIGEQISQMNTSQQRLAETTSGLVNVLRNTKTRGRWGEIQLRRVVELAGMNQYCDFREQVSTTNEEGRQQPDMVINLPAQRIIVIDAKAPMDAFLEAHDATDDEAKKHHFVQHAKSLRRHVGQLSQKSYAENFQQSPEFVLMFLPSEAIYSAALEYDADLIEYGALKNVIIATPSTLIALLKAAAHGWRQESIAKEVKQVGELGKQLYERLCKMTEHIVKLGESLDKSVKSYNAMVGSIESRVLTSARRFKDLQVIGESSDNIPEIEAIDTARRDFQAEEMKDTPENVGLKSKAVNSSQTADENLLNL